jgi:ubiquitin C-terminal hydrolase
LFGKYKSTITCENCKQSTEKYDDFMFLSVPITNSLEKSLHAITEDDELDENNLYKCDKCNTESLAYKKMVVHKMPNILIIYLKRFNKYQKMNGYVDVPHNYIDNSNNKFELFGVVNHFGGKNSGHYDSNIKIDNNWYNMDDSFCRSIDTKKVITSSAYILFYEKIV